MTISTQANKTIALGDGVQTVFEFDFVGVAAAYIEVILTDSSGNETVLSRGSGASQYQIVLNAAVTGAIWGIGGTVTYAPSGTPVPAGSSLTIFRTLPLTQAISLQYQGSLGSLGNGAETGLDTLEMQLQQISEHIARAIVAPIVDPLPPAPLPPVAQRANQGAAFDSDGNLVAGATPATGIISSAMQPVVDAATLALGRAAFGLAALATEGIGAGLEDDGSGNVRVNFGIHEVATNQAITASAHLQKYLATGGLTFTLDRANTLWEGFGFWIDALTAPVTLIPDSHDTIAAQTSSSGAAVTIPRGASVYVKTNAQGSGTWWIEWQLTQGAPAAAPSVTNLVIANNAGALNSSMDIGFDSAVLVNSNGAGLAAPASSLTVSSLASGLNGLDTGSVAANTWYYLWAISNGTTLAGLLSTSPSAPTLPPGYSFKKYLGAVLTDGTLRFYRVKQVNRRSQYVLTAATNTANLPLLISGSTGGAMSVITILSVAPPTAQEIFISLQMNAAGIVGMAPNANYGVTLLGTAAPPVQLNNVTAGNGIALLASLMLESTNIGFFSNTASSQAACLGWVDSRV